MHYVLTGFSQVEEFRVFTFHGVGDDRTRQPFWVRANLALTRRYGIPVQDLPLLCRHILEQRDDNITDRIFTFTEAEMSRQRQVVKANQEKVAQKRSTVRRRPSTSGSELGASWRGAPVRT